jgi:hypothetical protein
MSVIHTSDIFFVNFVIKSTNISFVNPGWISFPELEEPVRSKSTGDNAATYINAHNRYVYSSFCASAKTAQAWCAIILKRAAWLSQIGLTQLTLTISTG